MTLLAFVVVCAVVLAASRGFAWGAAGDVLVTVRVRPHRFFQRTGNDVFLHLPVTLQEAVLGARIESCQSMIETSAVLLCTTLIATETDEIQSWIDNAPFNKCINQNIFLFGGDEAIWLGGIESQDSLI